MMVDEAKPGILKNCISLDDNVVIFWFKNEAVCGKNM